MIWLLCAILTAVFESLKDVFSKKGLADVDFFVVAFSMKLFALPFLLPAALAVTPPALNGAFWMALGVGSLINAGVAILYMRAIQVSDLSLTVPLVSLTPLFMMATSPVLVQEYPSGSGLAGVGLIVAGAYLLHFNQIRQGILAPFHALLREPGPRLMLLVAFMWSISANMDKIGVKNSSPFFWSFAACSLAALLMLPLVLAFSRRPWAQMRSRYRTLVMIGLMSALSLSFQMIAVSLVLVAYVIAIKRTSTVMSVAWGHLLFKEPGLRERSLGAALMVAGVAVIALGA